MAWQKLIYFLFNDRVKIDEGEIIKEIQNIKYEDSSIKEYNLSELELSYKNETDKDSIVNKLKKI